MISRKKATVKNAITAFFSQIIKLLGQFLVQSIFIRTLGAKYLGANGLFNNILTFLAFAELGIGVSFSFSLYKPLAEDDEETISAIMTLFRKIYNVIGIVILILGLIVTIFVPNLVKANSSIEHIRYYFVLYLLSTVVSYFFTYNRSLLIADQLGYIDSQNQLVFSIIKYIFQIFFLLTFDSYTGYLVVLILTNLLSNIAITIKAKHRYKYLNLHSKKKPSHEVVKELKQNVIGTIASKVGGIVVNGTDNILISKFVGLGSVGIYSDYSLVMTGITSVLSQVLNSVVASFGNLGAVEKENKEKQINLFDNFTYFNAFFVFFCALVMYAIFQPFIKLWVGAKYHLSMFTVLIIIINFAFAQFRPALFLINSYGLFWGYRYKSIVEAVVNFGLSLFLVMNTSLGISGVLIGTIIGNILVNSWWDPLILFHGAFEASITKFYIKYWGYMLIFGILLFIENSILQMITMPQGVVNFIIYTFCVVVIVGIVLLLCFAGTKTEKMIINKLFKKV
ncbi:lipopolysaccharide biosynthesis protein [Ligilactobacillus aviarius]|uniref:lipopolysaccharide biosynthesis protein n=1 Tax=Ligilactobacillus aviarius TaxID=1606 RepID=UPI00195A7B32|nr:oligosaccharide flippase family protein [Ligilactobacillus aviarius]MBM6863116.1 oligosaccharide flippase family protein [Ligilactobacillus aviarius]